MCLLRLYATHVHIRQSGTVQLYQMPIHTARECMPSCISLTLPPAPNPRPDHFPSLPPLTVYLCSLLGEGTFHMPSQELTPAHAVSARLLVLQFDVLLTLEQVGHRGQTDIRSSHIDRDQLIGLWHGMLCHRPAHPNALLRAEAVRWGHTAETYPCKTLSSPYLPLCYCNILMWRCQAVPLSGVSLPVQYNPVQDLIMHTGLCEASEACLVL